MDEYVKFCKNLAVIVVFFFQIQLILYIVHEKYFKSQGQVLCSFLVLSEARFISENTLVVYLLYLQNNYYIILSKTAFLLGTGIGSSPTVPQSSPMHFGATLIFG